MLLTGENGSTGVKVVKFNPSNYKHASGTAQ